MKSEEVIRKDLASYIKHRQAAYVSLGKLVETGDLDSIHIKNAIESIKEDIHDFNLDIEMLEWVLSDEEW